MIRRLKKPKSIRPTDTGVPILSSNNSLTYVPKACCTMGTWSITTTIRYITKTNPIVMFIMRFAMLMTMLSNNNGTKLHHFFYVKK